MAAPTNHVCKLDEEQIRTFHEHLLLQQWEMDDAPYAHWRARKNKTTIVAYQSGKVSIQGKGTSDVVEFVLEPEVLKEARWGYEDVLAEEENPEMFEPHAGIDESGKGDFFGPLVIAAAYVDEETSHKLVALGVQDSKAIKNEKRMNQLAAEIRKITRGRFSIVAIGPQAYNRMYAKIGNVNRLLAWGHARALENLLEKQPDCPRAISDQFGRKATVLNALMEKGKSIELQQRHKAESDIAVAAASILARAEFVRRMNALGEEHDITLPKGASQAVLNAAAQLIARSGEEVMGSVAKLHFQTLQKAKAAAANL